MHHIISSFYDFNHQPVTNNSLKLQKENEKLLKVLNSMESNMKNRFEEEKLELQNQIASLESENKKYLETIIKHAKGETSYGSSAKAGSRVIETSSKPPLQYSENTMNRMYQKSPPKIPKTKEFTYSKYGSSKPGRNISGSGVKRTYKGSNAGGSIGQTQVRNLSLKQLNDMINDIYLSKVKYDKKCEENQLPRETMEQYMYTYLNQRYGLKNLIIEWAASIINGIKKYSKEDHSVSLFGKILRNECDEEFRFIQMHVQETLNNLLRAVLREKFPHKSEQGITTVFDQIHNGFIDDIYWARIIERMYDEQD